MHVLGIETSGDVAGVAVAGEQGVIVEYAVRAPRAHSRLLLDLVARAMEAAGLAGRQLAGLAVSAGPGSFTGLRIGFAAAKTLAQVWGLPLAAVPTLEVLAHPLVVAGARTCALIAARRGEVYAALYRPGPDGPACLAGPAALPVERLPEFAARAGEPVILVGDVPPAVGENAAVVARAPQAMNYPRPAVVAELGLLRLKGAAPDPLLVRPLYLGAPRLREGGRHGL
ncbi:MAG: tRNA (adenosine(37)-N6)-threonylcarbamoyltransferase complex dimerization subunit type 1 TsaB [Desulfotomaculales bacterium]